MACVRFGMDFALLNFFLLLLRHMSRVGKWIVVCGRLRWARFGAGWRTGRAPMSRARRGRRDDGSRRRRWYLDPGELRSPRPYEDERSAKVRFSYARALGKYKHLLPTATFERELESLK